MDSPADPQQSPDAARSSQGILDINQRMREALGAYIRKNAEGEKPLTNTPVTPIRPGSPSVVVVTPEARRSKACRRLFADADP
jgi:hypothetical protein